MSTFALTVLAVALAAAIGAIVYLVARASSLTDRLLEARDNAGTNAVAAERARFDADAATAALNAEHARADALQEFISHDAQQADASSPLAPDDVAGRVLRLARRWGKANVPGGPNEARAVDAGDVHPDQAAGPTAPADVHK